ncbi:VWA domain-containing protein [Occultella aeris]|uniref:von Willebrand factor type A domain protein n=1 Tax=Occultella aeris TaxID=2761496 RepID=A0A7M4DEB8_9MICO|nr:VWA domain-containing protein [Occultella aeris]VZO35232.1 von Willebrand factor type A domain protein [Occultella aeris]
MTLRMLLPLWLLLIIFVPLIGLALWRVKASHGARRRDWLRRSGILVAALVIGLCPAVPRTDSELLTSNAELFFVVDRTGSMAAEDYDDGRARLEGVQADMVALTEAMPGARYTIISFDSQATRQLPMTTDARAVRSWADTVTQEITAYSAGSSIDRPLQALTDSVNAALERGPENVRLVFFLSDGENTDGSDSTAGNEFESFEALGPLFDGGAVMGYGTSEGGMMRSYDGTSDTGFGTDAPYITGPDGQPGISQYNEDNLRTLAGQLGVEYTHRITPDDVSFLVEGIDVQDIAADGRRDNTTYRDVYWPAAVILALLLAWEAWDLTREVPRTRRKNEVETRDRRRENSRREPEPAGKGSPR